MAYRLGLLVGILGTISFYHEGRLDWWVLAAGFLIGANLDSLIWRWLLQRALRERGIK